MKQGRVVSKAELDDTIAHLKEVFDIVRVVDPYRTQVLDGELKDTQDPDEVCYKVWKKSLRCSNCISLKAYADFERKMKYEFQDDQAFQVISMPFRISDRDNHTVIVEMVSRVDGEMQVREMGKKIVAHAMNDFDRKVYTDSLTGVYNRRYFEDSMYLYASSSALSREVGFLYCDVTKFKLINDTYGHSVGDEALIKIAQALKKCTRANDTVMRMGGDEFLVVLENCKEGGVERTMERIDREVDQIVLEAMEGKHLHINMGYSWSDAFDADKAFIKKMLDEADERMYAQKVARRETREQ